MDDRTVWGISLQQIQIFLKAVELRNFTQTAKHFNFTPSMVSKTITALEAELGVTLFERKPHELKPTAAGVLLANEWRQSVSSIVDGIARARELSDGGGEHLVLGFVDSSEHMDRIMSDILRTWSEDHPGSVVTVEKHDMHRAAELLRSGMLDIVVTSAIEVPYLDEHGISWEKAFDSGTALFVPRGNPLFEREELDFPDIADQPFIGLAPRMHPYYDAWLKQTCRRHGFSPQVVGTFRTVRSLMFNLKLQSAVFLGESVTSDWVDEDLKMFPLSEQSYSVIAWNDKASRSLATFKDLLKASFA